MSIETTVILSLIMGLCTFTAIKIYTMSRQYMLQLEVFNHFYNTLSELYFTNKHGHEMNNLHLKYALTVLLEIAQQCRDDATDDENYEAAGKYQELIKQINSLIDTELYKN